MFKSIDPATDALFAEQPLDSDRQLEGKLAAASAAFERWQACPVGERAEHVRRLARGLRKDTERLATLMTREMGKPTVEAQGEVAKAAWCFEHYAEYAEEYLADLHLPSDASRSYVQYLPLGIVFGILPWNSPLWLAARCAAPALMAGNSVVIKHDEHVPACAAALAEHAAEHLPEGALEMVYVDRQGAERVLRDPRVQGVSFTGSTAGGKAVAGVAGSEAKPVVLELGGSDPAIVLADADLETAAATIRTSRMINAGQSCIAAKRIVVERSVYDDFVARLEAGIRDLRMGDPGDSDTEIGPMARHELRDELHRQVRDSIRQGARCLVGGEMPDGPGCFYPPTLLVDVPEDAAAFTEETFGPVAAVTPAADAGEALRIANASPYGLAAAVWTESERGEALARHIRTGQVAVNGLVKTDPRLPSGGIKNSGVGRELGPLGIREFVNAQQVWVGPAR